MALALFRQLSSREARRDEIEVRENLPDFGRRPEDDETVLEMGPAVASHYGASNYRDRLNFTRNRRKGLGRASPISALRDLDCLSRCNLYTGGESTLHNAFN